jgi:hypothetical protein
LEKHITHASHHLLVDYGAGRAVDAQTALVLSPRELTSNEGVASLWFPSTPLE